MSVVLGVDLGTSLCGIAVWDGKLRASKLVKPIGARLVDRRAHVLRVIERIHAKLPLDAVVVEEIGVYFHGSGSRARFSNLKGVIELGGTVEDWCLRAGVRCFRVSPAHWRKVVLGRADARKKQVKAWAVETFGRRMGDDEADAIGLACWPDRKYPGGWPK